MIGEYNLKMLCEKYNISVDKLVNRNNNILDKGEFFEIDKTLNYLINDLNISPSNIEKCPSILYRNVENIRSNIEFLKKEHISFTNIETCLHVLSTEHESLIDTYKYVAENYGVESINKITSVLACPKHIIKDVENLNLNIDKIGNLTISSSINFGHTNIENIQKMLQSQEYKEHPELFTSTTLAFAKIEDIQKMLQSQEYKEHPELFTSETLARTKIEDIQKMLQSQEYKEHPELFTSETLARTEIEDIQKMLQSQEYKEHPELFTSETLARTEIEDIQKMFHSQEYKEHPELFTSTTLAHAKIEDIQKMLQSKEYKEHPELFTSETLAYAKIEDIQKMLQSKEYKEHPELFTSQTLAHAKIEDIQKMLQSKEYKEHPELFTSQTLARAKIEDISKLLDMPYWKDERYEKLLTSSIVAKARVMISKLPILFKMAEEYEISEYINTSFLLFPPSKNYALINYLIESNLPLVIEGKLNPVFSYQPGALKSKYGIDVKELIKKYPYKDDMEEINKNVTR